MDALVTVQIDQGKLDAIRERTRGIPGALKRIVPRALNSAIVAARDPGSAYNLAFRRIGQALPVKKKSLKKRLFGPTKRNRATNIRWEASIACGSAPFSFIGDIPVSLSKTTGASVSMMGRTFRYPHAFSPPREAMSGSAWVPLGKYTMRSGKVISTYAPGGLMPGPKRLPQFRGKLVMRMPIGGGVVNWKTAQQLSGLHGRNRLAVIRGPSVGDVWRELPEIAQEVEQVGSRRVERALYIETENEIVKRMPK